MKKIIPYTFLLIASLLIERSLNADDWPHFLGPYGDTSVREKGIHTTFPDSGLPLIWSVPTGGGYSGPAVVQGRVFLMDRIAAPYQPGEVRGNPNFIRANIPGKERIRALDAKTGRILWEQAYACDYSTVYLYAIGPRCTPTVSEGFVYTLGAEGNLLCLTAANGEVVWARDFKTAYDLKIPEWGCAAHPLVFEDQVICVVGGEGSTVVSFDRHTGNEQWRALTSSKPGYCPPVIAEIHGKLQLLIWHGEGVASLNPSNGAQYWYTEVKPSFGMSIGAPRVFGDLVHVMGYKGVSSVLKVNANLESAPRIWGGDLRKGVAGVLNTAHLDQDGFLYSAGGGHMFRCVDIRTGERRWESSVPLQNSRLDRPGAWPSAFTFPHPPSGSTFIYNDHGELLTADLTPHGYKEIARTKLMEPTHKVGGRMLVWSAPAFSNGKIYLRNDQVIRCFDLSAQTISIKP